MTNFFYDFHRKFLGVKRTPAVLPYIYFYLRLISLENNYISISIPNKKLLIKGNNLSLIKILDLELLITGEFNSIEVINE